MEFTVRGTAQDAGTPYRDCECPQCEEGIVRHGPAATLSTDAATYLIDAPPDVKRTVGLGRIDEVLVSHAHVGHYAGLLFLGRESYDTDGLPVRCSEAVAEWLRGGNKAYHHLVERGNVALRPFEPGETIDLEPGVTCRPVEVDHRNEDGDTVGFAFEAGGTSLYYMTDLDRWTPAADRAVREADVALVDGTFYSDAEFELDRIDAEEVPHPPIVETMERFADCGTEIHFTHLNHTNPVTDPDSEAHRRVREAGFEVAADGMTLSLG